MKICFYYVDENYINYLKETEINVRGFTTVPNVRYSGRSKFVYGAVLEVNNVLYYVPVSHYNKDREYNLLIKIKHRQKTEVSEKNIALLKNSCDFTLLEKAYWNYLSNHSETDNEPE